VSWAACWTGATASEAHLVKGYLEQRHVPCVLRSDGPSIYPVPAFGFCVLVPDEWLRVAKASLDGRVRAAGRRRKPARVVALDRARRRA